ncbi:transglycosylase family protein [Streptomyces sp. 35G-GA-8]|uniref:transglycosylase family protein n=1 Tax=Streptomyces sp. 35G-GA-8 TaxID=2939434 RepID=UPI00201E9ACD|nr:transglycosylase family protein [Streptomyces sp. 35G-GA-8]MCL7380689.1 transglycosylase family protein [Streptomyces sp. 35G-GA-8]
MRSGNGRHRRPRQAPALIVAAGVTGSAIAIPLLGAAGASAADASTWDRVAECESGGIWSADLRNGYYGGLQISQETWDDFGGAEYAASADLASRSQQIAIAEKILDAQGPRAWASCAAIAGLTEGSPAPSVDPGTTPGKATEATPETASEATPESSGTPESSEPAESSGKTGKAGKAGEADSTAPSDTSSPAPGATASDDATPAPAESSGPSAGAAKGKHRGDAAADDAASGNSGEERESGRHASRGDGSTRNADGVTDGTEGAGAVDGEYTVRAGDCLWLIADEREVPGGWSAIYEANKDTVGADPDLIFPGQTLDLGVK